MLKDLVIEYMQKQKLMQLATVSNNKPWICNVWYGFDEDMNIYFFSATNRRHSIEIQDNSFVAGAMAYPQSPSDPAVGLQFEGTVSVLVDQNEIDFARSHYEGRIFQSEIVDEYINHTDKPHAFYKIVVDKYVLFDTINFPEESRQEYLVVR